MLTASISPYMEKKGKDITIILVYLLKITRTEKSNHEP